MLDSMKNAEILKNAVVVKGSKDTNYIESLSQGQTLNSLREYGKLVEEISSMENPTKEFKKTYFNSLIGFLSWDLAFNGKFDGTIEKWSMAACGIIPKEFEDYKFLADEIAIFSKSYVNYYAAMVK